MLNWLAKLLLTSTAIAPVLITYAWVAYQADEGMQAAVLMGACLVLIVICILMPDMSVRIFIWQRRRFRPAYVQSQALMMKK